MFLFDLCTVRSISGSAMGVKRAVCGLHVANAVRGNELWDFGAGSVQS